MTPDSTQTVVMAMVGVGAVVVLWAIGQRFLDQVRDLVAQVQELVERLVRQETRHESLAKDVGRLEARMDALERQPKRESA